MRWILGLLISFQAQAIEQDKALHFIGSYAIGSTLAPRVGYWKATAATLGVGLTKELLDSEFSNEDMRANALGILTYSVVHYAWEF
jgi:hypothetical protein